MVGTAEGKPGPADASYEEIDRLSAVASDQRPHLRGSLRGECIESCAAAVTGPRHETLCGAEVNAAIAIEELRHGFLPKRLFLWWTNWLYSARIS
ncbi:hypothetical protein GCM10022404_20940 [Celeribacter arenosi]|uniref:Uncharacterized protein n=1 Tax=Celeribacter arenosi TaxID=792649 RepID=A0ABP7KA71_9RHOB